MQPPDHRTACAETLALMDGLGDLSTTLSSRGISKTDWVPQFLECEEHILKTESILDHIDTFLKNTDEELDHVLLQLRGSRGVVSAARLPPLPPLPSPFSASSSSSS